LTEQTQIVQHSNTKWTLLRQAAA